MLATATLASAATPPQQLLNKAIVVAFLAGVARYAEPALGAAADLRQRQGPIFVRSTRSGGKDTDSGDVSHGTYRCEGGRIIGRYNLNTGANQTTMSFDPSIASCTAALQFGRPSGESYCGTGSGGVTRTSDAAPTASGVSCSIRDGNPFGQ